MVGSVRNWLLLIICFFIGLFQSIRGDYFLWDFDSDIASIPVVLKDISRYGFVYLRDFRFPLDNWLLTVLLPDALWFRLFGDGPVSIMMTGLALFVFNAVLAGGLVAYVAGVKRGVWAAALTLCAPRAALGVGGYLIYPVAHHVSIAWGLAALLCALVWLRGRNGVALVGMVLVLIPATFSDPWMLPAFDLPLICTGGMLWLGQKKNVLLPMPRHAGAWAGLIVGVLCAIIVGKTHFLGVMPIGADNIGSFTKLKFLPQVIFNIFVVLSYYFNFLPGVTFQDFGWDLDNHKILPAVGLGLAMLFNGAVLLIAMFMLLRRWAGVLKTCDIVRVFFFVFLIFSLLGVMSSAFVLGSVKYLSSARYLVNIYYCVILLFFISPWERFSTRCRRFYVLLGVLWVTAGIVSNMGAWSLRSPLVRLPDAAIVSALEAEHIDTAYGSYWGSEAHAMTWLSHGKVHVRPLLYEPDYHGFLPSIWSSPRWYRHLAHERWALIITSTDGNDVCLPFPSCEDAAIYQFGPPLAVRQAARAKIMIYDNDRVGEVAALSVNSWKTSRPLPDESTFSGWRSFYPDRAMNRNALVTIEGWSVPAYGKVMSNAVLARVGVPVPASEPRTVRLRFLLSSNRAALRDVDVRYKGRIVAQWRVGLTAVPLTLELPVEAGERFVSCDLLIRDPGKGRHGTAEGVVLSEVQVVE